MGKWKKVPLKNLTTLMVDGDWVESKDQSTEGIRLVQTGNIGEGEYLDKPKRAKYISEKTFIYLSCTEVFGGDVLVSRLPSPVGRACILPQSNTRMVTAVDCTVIRFDKARCLSKYFVYFSMTILYQYEVAKHIAGSTRVRISRKNLETVRVPLPSLEIQEQIAQTLDTTSELLSMRQQQLAELDNLIKSTFYYMFGDPVGNEKGWKVIQLADCLSIVGGYAFKSTDFSNEGIPIIKIGNINSGTFHDKGISFWNYDKKFDKYLLYPNDIVISLTGTVGKDDYANVCIL
ncbi:MAG: EcoKI restriction-modification system protein HsdS [Pelotomaculum sp. PtaU1.Bin035]|nr:MAG: EcoKI restriction-modification system protein HsdS [Pelotomaculum sp. PtaU1.Bin035]